jgi:hypothetical protein
LTLNTNGSFTYTPAAGFIGTDTFTYTASDGSLSSNVATVTINVQSLINVSTPNGSESWSAGSPQTIRWTYTGNPGSYVRIELLKGAVVNRTIATSVWRGSGGNGSYNWTIPTNQMPGLDYRIRVTSVTNAAYTDMSNNYFTITTPSITVAFPNGGDILRRGNVYTINWTYTGNPGSSVGIRLLKNGVFNQTITFSTPIGTGGNGSFNWTIPANKTLGTDYRIRIYSISNSAYNDTSNANFSIAP